MGYSFIIFGIIMIVGSIIEAEWVMKLMKNKRGDYPLSKNFARVFWIVVGLAAIYIGILFFTTGEQSFL